MSPKRGFVCAFAGAPLVASLLVLAGCDSGPPAGETDTNRNPRNELNKESMDYMRKQYESKQQKKK
jgi:hypothetical protein